MKKPILDVERQKYMKKERRKIEAEIDKYNKILRSQKNKNKSKNPIQIKRKIEMILGREKASLGNLRRKQPYRREVNPKIKIYGKGMNYNSVKNVRLKPNLGLKGRKYGIGQNGNRKKPIYKLPRLY
jgi:hypothetical protein